MKLIASLAPAEVEAGVVAKADQYCIVFFKSIKPRINPNPKLKEIIRKSLNTFLSKPGLHNLKWLPQCPLNISTTALQRHLVRCWWSRGGQRGSCTGTWAWSSGTPWSLPSSTSWCG